MATSSEELVKALRESLKENDRLWQRYQDLVTASHEPIAIVGMGCRFPGGATSPETLWHLVASGVDGISPFPADRGWDLEDFGDIAEVGGFLHEAPHFDAELFGISPREALAMDPQQRLLLETSWEALERAGIAPLSLSGSRTGVFCGVSGNGYGGHLHEGTAETEGYLLTGSTPSIVSGRIAYTLGFEGPAVSVDTACSSALTALHLACQALRAGECTMALAGGATIMANPGIFLEFARQGGLARDGRCKAFADVADGTGWAEGAGVLVLERLSDAQRLGHPVLAVVRGSAVNQDGASNGLTAPNGPSQQRVIQQALDAARLSPSDVDAVEAHGTGTRLGDPIEAQALMATYGQGRDGQDPLWLGSVKSNIGHSQAAAGAASVIKMVMALRNQRLPKTLHADTPSSHVDWNAGAVRLLTEARAWPRDPQGERPRRAGVSAFAISGTNAHIILEEAPATRETTVKPSAAGLPVVPWVLSGRSAQALRAQAGRLATFLEEDGAQQVSAADVGLSLAATRTVLEHRAVVLGADQEALRAGVTSLEAGGADGATVVSGTVAEGRTAWMFTGQGSQRPGMGRELYECFPVFAQALDEVCRLLDAELAGAADFGVPVREVLFAAEGEAEAALLDRTGYAQTGLFAVQVALVQLLRSWGMSPDVVLGHSIGEVVAAYTAGVFELTDAARLVAARARLMQALPTGGAMAAIEADEAEVTEILDGLPDASRAEIAAVNGPTAVVVSGVEAAVVRTMTIAQERGHRVSRLRVSHAFHSQLMEPMLDTFADVAEGIRYHRPTLAAVSTVSGQPVTSRDWATPGYWVDQVRRPVRFHDALRTATGPLTVSRLLEVGPDPVLTGLAGLAAFSGITQDSSEPAAASVLRKGRAEAESLLSAASEMFVRGAKLDWPAVFAGTGAQRTELPTYAFQRQRYWLRPSRSVTDATGLGLGAVGHPLLGAALRLAGSDTVLLTSRLSVQTHPWLADHVVAGAVVVPGTVCVELAVQAGDQVGCDHVADLTLREPLVLPREGTLHLQITVEPADDDPQRTLRIYGRSQDAPADQSWTLHATGTLTTAGHGTDWDLRAWPPEGAEPIPAEDLRDLYERLAEAGLTYGPAFRGLREAWRHGEDLLVEAVLPEQAAEGGGTGDIVGGAAREVAGDLAGHVAAHAAQFGLHPALLDTVLHALGLAEQAETDASLPFLWSGVSLSAVGASTVRARLSPRGAGSAEFALRVADAEGEPVAEVASLVLRPVSNAGLLGRTGGSPTADSLYRLEWTPIDVVADADAAGTESGEPEAPGWAVLTDPRPWQASGVPVTGYADLAALTSALDDGESTPDTVLLSLTHGEDTKAAEVLADVLRLVHTWLDEERLAQSRLVLVTSGAVRSDVTDLAGAAVWGLVRSAMSEHPSRFVLADVDNEPSSYRALADVLARTEESQCAVHGGEVWLPRIARMATAPGTASDSASDDFSETTSETASGEDSGAVSEARSEVPEKVMVAAIEAEAIGLWPAHGTVLITGGTGGLGAVIARHLVSNHGVRNLLLLSRRGPNAPGAGELHQELTDLGAQVTMIALDVSDRDALAVVLDGVSDGAPLTGIVHAAGVLDDGLIADLTPERLNQVLAAKAESALHLHELTRDNRDLTAFVLFSSFAGVVGNAGQAAYAAANSLLDALALSRRTQGLATVSLAWGMWEHTDGMGGRMAGAEVARLRRLGFPPLRTQDALTLFDTALGADEPLVLPVALHTTALAARRDSLPAVLRGIVPASASSRRRTVGGGGGSVGLVHRLRGLSSGEQERLLLDLVQSEVAAVLGHQSGAVVDPVRAFKDLGFDSLTAVDLRNRLNRATALTLPATLVFDHPSPSALTAYLRKQVLGESAEQDLVPSSARVVVTDEPIAIVGMGCRYPGGVTSPEALWGLAASGGDGISFFPSDRGWDVERLFDPDGERAGSSYVCEGGFLLDAAEFDSGLFGISPREALAMDPQQRLLLETSWEALERAGLDPLSLRGSATGVFAGLMYHDYASRLEGIPEEVEGLLGNGNAGSVFSGRVSYVFGFEGPAVTVDTACSSSL
ncbi:type I polyketide synthase, partial [Streptomyces coffeae]